MVLWVFGYGSLIWNPGFDYEEKLTCFIKGYRRVFYQGSTDHRGTPEFPGRTVTLLQEDGAVTWGVAYRVAGGLTNEAKVMEYLEFREKQYDVKLDLDVYTNELPDVPTIRGVLVFYASDNTESNRNYLGPAPVEEMARRISLAEGPSGKNHDYLFRLVEVLKSLGIDDDETEELSKQVRKFLD